MMRVKIDTTTPEQRGIEGLRPALLTTPGIYYLGKGYRWFLVVTRNFDGMDSVSRVIVDASGIRVCRLDDCRLFIPVPPGTEVTLTLGQD